MPGSDSTLASLIAILEGRRERAEEQRLLDMLAAAAPEVLNEVLSPERVPLLFSVEQEHLLGPDHRAALLRLLSEERVADLHVPARATLVRRLAIGRTGSREERAVHAVFLATTGRDLTALKNLIDGSFDYHDLVELVFHDIDDAGLRGSILGHIAAEGAWRAGLKILSDIDDTLYENWVDKRYPPKTIYPGVRQLYAELAGVPERPEDAAVTFVTARPDDRLGIIEDATRRALAERGLPRACVLSGTFTHLVGNASIAEGKLSNFQRYREVFPEYEMVFFGDSVQGDIVFGQHMREVAPEVVPAIFIHDVVATPEARRAELRAGNVHLFDTYAGAAIAAFEAGLIGAEAVRRVADAARRELAGVPFASEEQRSAREADLARDLARAP